jgi:hypothetical protein
MGSLEIGFVDSPSNNFQAINLNIVSVRLNPSTDASVSDADPNWVSVSAPPGAGPGELSVNLLELQNNAMVFNIGQVTAQVYHQIEVMIDSTHPGLVIPSCVTGASPPTEGCITANASFSSSTSSSLRTTDSTGFNVTSTGLNTLIIDISPGNPVPPASPGGNYTLNPSISLLTSPGSLVQMVSGTVAGAPVTGGLVNAELTGTSAIVASAPITNGSYSMVLPASAAGGTFYDLFVSAQTTYAVLSGLLASRGGTPITQNFAVATAAGVAVTGSVTDARTGSALNGATVNLFLPASSSDDCMTSLAGCVIVATTTTNSSGIYNFGAVPPPPSGTPYYVQASDTGTNIVTQLLTYGSPSTCTGSTTNCSFQLPNNLLSGTIVVSPAPSSGTNTVVTLIAEQTGTGNLVGLGQFTVPFTGHVGFNMEIPTTGNVDLIASADDTYLGVGTPYSGHQLAVASNVAPGSSPTLVVNCMGHGTIFGSAVSSDAGTQMRLSQVVPSPAATSVQLVNSNVGNSVPVPGASSTPEYPNQFSFCAPPGSYIVQRFQQSGPSSTPSPAGAATPITVLPPSPVPSSTASPCALCELATPGQCPSNCSATSAGTF